MNTTRATIAGIIATAAVTTLWLVEPFLGLPRLAVGSMLSSFLAVATAYLPIWPAVGWGLHVAVGIALAMIYARWLVHSLPGSPFGRGVLYGCLVFLVAQLGEVGVEVFSILRVALRKPIELLFVFRLFRQEHVFERLEDFFVHTW